jgi:ribose transport system substrate-binding protein
MNRKTRWLLAPAVGSLAIAATLTGFSSVAAATTPLKIAYMSYVNNSYDTPMIAAAQAEATKLGATMTVFDAAATPATQVTQLQDVVSSGSYTGVLLQPIYPAAEISEVQAVIAAKIPVVNMDQILGTNYKNTGIQVPGLDGNVVFAPATIGTQLGVYTNMACGKLKNCQIALIHNYLGYEPDLQVTTSFKAALAAHKADKVVAEADAAYSQATATTKVEDILTANPHINVIAGSDQDCEGAQTALKLDHFKHIKLVCYGGSKAAVAGIKSGLWTADIAQLPATEGRLGMAMLVKAIQTGKGQGSQNPVAKLANKGVVLKSNVSKFHAEWAG